MIDWPATFNHVGCCVTDLQRARRFHEGALGFRYERELKPPDGVSSQGLTHVSIAVDDMDNVLHAVEELGGRVRTETHIGVAVLVEDPDGQVIEL